MPSLDLRHGIRAWRPSVAPVLGIRAWRPLIAPWLESPAITWHTDELDQLQRQSSESRRRCLNFSTATFQRCRFLTTEVSDSALNAAASVEQVSATNLLVGIPSSDTQRQSWRNKLPLHAVLWSDRRLLEGGRWSGCFFHHIIFILGRITTSEYYSYIQHFIGVS